MASKTNTRQHLHAPTFFRPHGFIQRSAEPGIDRQRQSDLFELLDQQATSPFEIELWEGTSYHLGPAGQPQFRVEIRHPSGLAALRSLNELRICEAYIAGELEFSGSMLKLFDLKRILSLQHPWLNFIRLIRPWFVGQVRDDAAAIATHYDYDDEFYMLLLDPTRTYSQGVFESDDETLETAMRRKLDFAIESCQLQPGMKVLDVGGGWGAFTEYAGQWGIEVTSLTISDRSLRYLNRLILEKNLPCRAIQQNFMTYQPAEKYDAVVILGVIEHLPNYRQVVQQLQQLLRLGGRAYLDGSASKRKFSFNAFLNRHIYPGNHCTLSIHDFLAEVQHSSLELLSVHSDRHSYYLTSKLWAEKLEAAKAEIIERWGRELYCKFHLYLWGVCHNFLKNDLQAYRLVLEHNPRHQL